MIRRVSISLVFITAIFILFNINVQNQEKTRTGEFECDSLRKPREIILDNVIWQVMKTRRGRINLLNAYLDSRFNRKVVRINALGPNFNETYRDIHCQFWFDDGKVKVVRVFRFFNLWKSAKLLSNCNHDRLRNFNSF
jgi:hypothetical protein